MQQSNATKEFIHRIETRQFAVITKFQDYLLIGKCRRILSDDDNDWIFDRLDIERTDATMKLQQQMSTIQMVFNRLVRLTWKPEYIKGRKLTAGACKPTSNCLGSAVKPKNGQNLKPVLLPKSIYVSRLETTVKSDDIVNHTAKIIKSFEYDRFP